MTEPLDVTRVTRDALLLDALGRGDPPPPDDDVATILAAWRADLAEPAVVPAQAPVRAPAEPGREGSVAARRPLRREVRVRATRVRATIAAAAAVVGLAGGAVIAASDAGPGSPLWPITRLVYEDRADARIAERDAQHAIAAARDAIDDGRYGDAGRHLDEATVLIGRITDTGVAGRLQREVDALRALLPADVSGPDTAPSAPAPGGPAPTAPAGAVPGQSSGPGPGSTPGGGGVLPGPPLPSLPVPLPPLPSLPPLPPVLE